MRKRVRAAPPKFIVSRHGQKKLGLKSKKSKRFSVVPRGLAGIHLYIIKCTVYLPAPQNSGVSSCTNFTTCIKTSQNLSPA